MIGFYFIQNKYRFVNGNENLIHTNKNGTNIAMTYKKLLKYFF
jgi:hypothetical protein